MDIKNARRKSFDVSYVVVTEENIEDVAAWCNGEIDGEDKERFVKVSDKNAISARQTKAFVDDYVLKMSETGTSFKAFTEKAFKKSYETIETLRERTPQGGSDREVARSAVSGKFVSHNEATTNPETTVVEKVTVAQTGSPYYENVVNPNDENDVTTVYYSASGVQITRAEYDAWGTN